jgi:predicted transcriptional regulator
MEKDRIAKTLGVSQPLVNADIVYLKEQATSNLATHIHETIPMNYKKCLSGLNQVLQITWELQEKSTDNKEKLQSLSLLKDCYRYLMEMSSDSTTIREAMTFVKERLSKQKGRD